MTRRSAKANKNLKVYISCSKSKAAAATEIKEELEAVLEGSPTFEVFPFKTSHDNQAEKNRVGQFHEELSQTDVFIHCLTEDSTSVEWLHHEVRAAKFHADGRKDRPLILISALIEELPENAVVFPELIEFSEVDMRSPENIPLAGIDLRKRIFSELDYEASPQVTEAFREYVFAEIASPNPRLSSLKRVIRQVFSALFKEHVGKKLDELTNLRRAQEKLMTPEVIQVAEAQAFDDIWVVSHTLHTELHDKDMIPSILENLLEKGIHYTFFVPDSNLAKRAIEKIHNQFQEKSKDEPSVTYKDVSKDAVFKSEVIHVGSGQYQFIFLEQGVFMPFDELVIYDGENPSASWGYIQMRYESSEDTPLTLRVPQRSLNLVSNFLLDYKKKSLYDQSPDVHSE